MYYADYYKREVEEAQRSFLKKNRVKRKGEVQAGSYNYTEQERKKRPAEEDIKLPPLQPKRHPKYHEIKKKYFDLWDEISLCLKEGPRVVNILPPVDFNDLFRQSGPPVRKPTIDNSLKEMTSDSEKERQRLREEEELRKLRERKKRKKQTAIILKRVNGLPSLQDCFRELVTDLLETVRSQAKYHIDFEKQAVYHIVTDSMPSLSSNYEQFWVSVFQSLLDGVERILETEYPNLPVESRLFFHEIITEGLDMPKQFLYEFELLLFAQNDKINITKNLKAFSLILLFMKVVFILIDEQTKEPAQYQVEQV